MYLLLAFVAAVFLPYSAEAQCSFPPELVGAWKGNAWTDLTVNTTFLGPLVMDGRTLSYECLLNEGSRYVLRSTPFLAFSSQFRFFICVNITKSPDNNDVFYYYVGTENNPDHTNSPVIGQAASAANPNITTVCNKITQTPAREFNLLLKQGWETRVPAKSCPAQLQAIFVANFTGNSTTTNTNNCTNFIIDGCSNQQRELTFNYTTCGLGNTTLHCVFNMMESVNTTYTSVYMAPVQGQTNPYAPYSCIKQSYKNDTMTITHDAGKCGGTPSEMMILHETESCPVPTTTASPTQAPSNTTEGNGSQSTPWATTTANGGQGGGGNGDASEGNMMYAEIFSLIAALFVVKLVLH